MNYKTCCTCKEEKNIDEFWYRNKIKNIRQPKCKVCTLLYQKKHYKESINRKNKIANANSALRTRNHIFVNDYLKSNPCVDCGECDPIVLEFDHIEKGIKFKNISVMIHNGYSLERIKQEILKCEVRCCNCHRRKTSLQFNWRIFL